MNDTNNNPITEEDFTKGESVRVETPVEKTVEELFERRKKELKDWQYGTVYKLYDREEECEVLADDVDRYFDDKFIQEVKSQVRRETIKEILKLKNAYHVRIEKIEEYALSNGITLKN